MIERRRSIVRFFCAAGIVALLGSIGSASLTAQTGQVARSAAGQVGQRQTREQAAAKVAPMSVVANGRIQNRIQSRLRARIDRYYDPQANTLSPFVVAADQERVATKKRR